MMAYQELYITIESVIFVLLISNFIHFSREANGSPMSDISRSSNKEGCNALLVKFASSTANFTHCAIINARPIKLCESCVRQYLNVVAAHEEILKLEDDKGQACKKKLINLDRLEIIERGFRNVHDLWETGHCDCCFESRNGTVVSELNNITLTFEDHHRKTNDCIQSHYNFTSKSYDSLVCTSCFSTYCKMNDYYDSLKEIQGDGNICIDIVDSMNTTRKKWSDTLGCGRKKLAPETPLLVSIILIILTPITFYIVAKVFSSKVESRIIQQKRLVEHLRFPSTSGIGLQ